MSVLSQNPSALSNVAVQKINSSVVTVTPELAKKWLEGMVENQRNPSERSVLKYSRAMSEGKWETASPLSFNSEGQLIDGQHRLLAVIKAKRSIDFIVLHGLAKTAIHALDMGVSRTAAHLARLKGLSLTNAHLAVLNCCFYAPSGGMRVSPFSKQEQVELAEKHFDALDFAVRKRGSDLGVYFSPYFAPVARAYYSENHKRLEQFLQVLHSGFTVSENPNDDLAAIALRNVYFRNKGTGIKAGAELDRIQGTRIASNALANFILRKPVKVCKESSSNHFPVADFDYWWKQKELK